jgi:hypothetical protein
MKDDLTCLLDSWTFATPSLPYTCWRVTMGSPAPPRGWGTPPSAVSSWYFWSVTGSLKPEGSGEGFGCAKIGWPVTRLALAGRAIDLESFFACLKEWPVAFFGMITSGVNSLDDEDNGHVLRNNNDEERQFARLATLRSSP